MIAEETNDVAAMLDAQSSEHVTPESRSTLGKVFRMGLPELACRSRQAAFKWLDRLNRAPGHTPSLNDRASLSRFVGNGGERFFPGPFDPLVPAAIAFASARHCQEVVATADEICRGEFNLLGYRGLDLGNPPDWHFDPIANRRAPIVHWSRLDPLDYATVGDSKVIWELNRHQWMVTLAQAYRLTRDERYPRAIVRYVEDWLRANPRGIGINWASSLEVAIRLIAWCWTLVLIRDSAALSPDLFARIVESVRAHATHIERYLSYYFSPNTHLTGEALGLLYAAIVFPDLGRAERWRSIAMRILVGEVERQVLDDGIYFERSTCYQRYTVDIYLHFLILASRGGFEVPATVERCVKGMLDSLIALRQPDGSMPTIGDADGGSLLPLSKTQPHDFRGTFSTAAVIFKAPLYAWAAGDLAPETLWLLGTSAVEPFETLERRPPVSDPTRMFPEGGLVVFRSGWDRTDHSLIFDTGPVGCPGTGGHGHADLLSIQCSVFGQEYLVDAGTCCYTADPKLRDFFRGTAAHSTVVIDGRSQAEPGGPFAWQSRSSARLLRWHSGESLAFADAEHDGYRALPDPVSHRRRVIFVKGRYWVLVDDVTGAGTHRIDVRFQFAPMDVSIDKTGWVRATSDGRQGLLVRVFSSAPVEAELREGRRDPFEGWISPNYGQLERAPALVCTTTTELPLRLVTLLWPRENIVEANPSVKVIQNREGVPVGLELPELAEVVLFDDREPVIERSTLTSTNLSA